MDPIVVLLAVIGAFTVAAVTISFLSGFIAGGHHRFGRRVLAGLNRAADNVEKFLIGIFHFIYREVRGHEWRHRHYHRH